MEKLSPARPALPFILHSVGAALFALLFAWLAYRMFFTPVDLFVHHTYLSEALLRFGAFGAVFYGFSLVMLRFCPVSNFWGSLYAVGSWLLFVIAFLPTLPLDSTGMMRRGDFSADDEAIRQSVARNFQIIRVVTVFGFGLIQAIFLWRAARPSACRAGAPPAA